MVMIWFFLRFISLFLRKDPRRKKSHLMRSLGGLMNGGMRALALDTFVVKKIFKKKRCRRWVFAFQFAIFHNSRLDTFFSRSFLPCHLEYAEREDPRNDLAFWRRLNFSWGFLRGLGREMMFWKLKWWMGARGKRVPHFSLLKSWENSLWKTR